jgi:hypothetical protein
LGYAAVLRAYESSYELRAAAREVDERWTELHWIHGNLTATNVLVEHQPALRVSFIDPCGVGLGEPAWDLAAAVDMISWLAPRWSATPQLLADYLILGYRGPAGPVTSIRQSRPYGRWLPLYGSKILHMSRQARHPSRENWNSGWIGLAGTPLESGAS